MYWIGIDLGGTNMVAGLVNAERKIIDRVDVKTRAPRPVESLVRDMGEMVRSLLNRNGLRRGDIRALGVGVPCIADQENGHMEDGNNLGYTDVPFVSLLEAETGLPVFFGNDAKAAAWGEYLGGNYTEDSMLMVTLGTGIGGGIILDRKIWGGFNHAAGEIGHMTLQMNGLPCTCGRRGCFEVYGSASALIRQTRAAMEENRDSLLWLLCGGELRNVEAKTVFDGAAAGDPLSKALLDTYTTYLAEGISGLINILQPALVCIGGGVSRAGDALLLPLREKTRRLLLSRSAPRNAGIVLARLGNDAGILGAALLGEKG